MSDVAIAPAGMPAVLYPPTVSFRESWPWALLAAALLALAYFVCVDQGALSIVPGTALHEFVHDGRHLLGFPCH